MTSARRQRKSARLASGLSFGLSSCLSWCVAWGLARDISRGVARGLGLAVVLMLAVPSVPRVGAATTERVVHDTHSGLAINGIDPVAYFTDAAPLYGLADYEYRYAGVVWRFRNEGNKAAFIANPDVYMPRFGGYDSVAIGRDVALPGNPLLWVIVGERLYLFYNDEARARFIAKPDDVILLAESRWPAVVGTLVN
jgi:YHS domain-containing protein